VGRRGRNRKGLYVALLFILELQYESERRIKGDTPAQWHPSPRNRPNHFCFWVMDALSSLNGPEPKCFGELLDELEHQRLPHVATMLDYTVSRRFGGNGEPPVRELDMDVILEGLGSAGLVNERHPQARKFARVVSDHLDVRWRDAVAATAPEFDEVEGLPKMAFLLGALPPSFHILNQRIFACLDDAELIREHRMLTVLQFYGLVTGTLPPAPPSWSPALRELAEMSHQQVELLANLSGPQASEVRRLGDPGWCLAMLRRRLRLSPRQWSTLGTDLRTGADSGVILRRGVASRIEALIDQGQLEPWQALRKLAQSEYWESVGHLDEEVIRMIARGELTRSLADRVAGWSDPIWHEISELLSRHRDWAVAYLEDCRTLEELFASRTGARLNLRDLFPKTSAWLDAFLSEHMEDALMGDVGELETLAGPVSRLIRERMWLHASEPVTS
jgi:hypothetical protein